MADLEKSELGAFSTSLAAFVELCNDDTDTFYESIEPEISVRSALEEVSDDMMSAITNEPSLSRITSLNLSLNHIKSLKNVSLATSLEKLCMNFNMITSVDELKFMPHLSYLELSHNKIKSIEPIKLLKNLSVLDMSHNLIDDIRVLF